MNALERARKLGDHKYILLCETYGRFQAGEIDKPQARQILARLKADNTVTMWVKE